MSSTIKAAILARAIELWRDPSKRCQGDFKSDDRMCAWAALVTAAHEVEGGKDWSSNHGWTAEERETYSKRLGAYLDLGSGGAVIKFNDRRKNGPALLYARMQQALAQEIGK